MTSQTFKRILAAAGVTAKYERANKVWVLTGADGGYLGCGIRPTTYSKTELSRMYPAREV
ncbi:hypothetical protein [Niveispirillum sp.]|uniref:hypothetical protein n=1 Tax=Niveispirillum sp. TaxID=1917217 RepID=UPI001B5F6EDE|nr:hypothetical protein [Niveispirillum sp.]MBP7338784.1 hypothetical protein [Niveispirillum sp.]